jgi:Holliday junction resolvasome RuvABC endonuclease subunit
MIGSCKGTDVIEVCHKVPLTKPWKDEGQRIHTHKNVVDKSDIDALYSQLKGLLEYARAGQGVCGLAIERSVEVSQRKRGIGANMATCLKNTEGLALLAYALGRALGYHVEMAKPEEVRKALCGNAKASNAQISAVFQTFSKIDGWPLRSNEHERDAAAVAMFCGRRYGMQRITEHSLPAVIADLDHTFRYGAG